MEVREWMSAPVHTVGTGTPLSVCAERMHSLGIRHLPVVDADGHLVLVLSDFAFEMRGLFMSGRFVPFDDTDTWLLAEQVAHEVEVVCLPNEELSSALGRLRATYQDCVIIVDDDRKPLGIVTEHDVVGQARSLLPSDASFTEISSTDLPLLSDETTASDARSWMARHRHRHVLMVDDGILKGVLSYRDVALEDAIQHIKLTDVVHRPVSRMEPLTAREAAEILYENKFGCLPIVDDQDRPKAIITRSAIIAAVLALL